MLLTLGALAALGGFLPLKKAFGKRIIPQAPSQNPQPRTLFYH
jgi:hypothetical protein